MTNRPNLRLSLDDCLYELCHGAFSEMSKEDRYTFADAGPHVLRGEIRRGNHNYRVLFDCVACEFEINLWSDDSCDVWVIDTTNGEVREL